MMLLLTFFLCVPQADAQEHRQLRILLHGERLPVYHERDVINGMASWYGERRHGNNTASGERFHYLALTAAHRTLPFGTVVRVTNLKNKKSVNVRITDRGPLSPRFMIDISKGAAQAINMVRAGIAPVSAEILELPAWYRKRHPSNHPARRVKRK